MNQSISAADLDIDFNRDDFAGDALSEEARKGRESVLFRWFIASFLMGKHIQAGIACEAYRVIVNKHGRDTPRKLGSCTHRQLVAFLGEAHYVRYDESTADRLGALCHMLIDHYGGRIENIYLASENRQAFEKRLTEFEGVGPKTVEIFMREAARVLY